MNQTLIGLLIGGVAPAILYGIGNVLVKITEREGLGIGPLLLCVGVAVIGVGCIALLIFPDRGFTMKSVSYGLLFGVLWGIGTLCVAFALSAYGIPLAKLVPLYNTNTLVAVVIALVIFHEWRDIQTTRLLLGAGLIIIGSVLVVRA